jgi:hypothetical protein
MASWTALTNQPTFNASTMLLLTDGTVMVQAENQKSWSRLTPDSSGSYVNGTWSTIADMANSRLYYASAVLADGRVLVAGGEYSDAGGDTDKAEIYDPTTNAWTSIGNPGWGQLGDAAACMLADGRLLVGNLTDSRTAIYDPVANTWTATGNMAARSNEEAWNLLPDGTVLTVSCANHPNAEKYVPSSGTWVSAGATPVELVQASSIEIGPALLMPNGQVFCVGATGHTALYTAPANPSDPGTWTAGPDFPADTQGRLLKAKDAPACLLPNGRVLCVVGSGGDAADDWPSPSMFFEFDGASLTRAPDPSNANTVTYEGRLLLLPTGEALYAAGTAAVYVYMPDGGPQASWKPTITNWPSDVQLGGTFTISGTQFNGLSQAVSYGDDAQQATNYPLLRATRVSDGSVSYWRTSNHSTMAVTTGSATVSTNFTVPSGIPQGAYQLCVVANGIASDQVPVNVDAGNGTASYLLVDKYVGGGAVLWAYVAGSWYGQDIADADLGGIARDLFAADRVDAWWNAANLTVVRGWKTPH